MSGLSRLQHVLVVDDDPADTMMIEEALLGVATPPVVHTVEDGREALDYLRRHGRYAGMPRPDLVLLDLNMPRMGGHEVLNEIKADDDLKSIPIVVLTTSTAAPDITASYAKHANAYVSKPMDLESFEAAVRQINNFYSEIAILPALRQG
ncbi:putative response regulator receiver domain protein [Actinoplanes missouriensis 431]|uniref:Putative response regulator receiver domain protein n=1 Tax=Actinoplanes missouriensis (strain ATCC 14538 / DSM 43046 / CBS 188.64 / JCM 3121 / NBRC 102363 / NCIMB 12654 / NRRL B-3342 / UNCC 431) TaxID=512565 RepID=I0H8D8_ACTM4|nr:response regulator [Actinoplanes missouriensis]BAL89275.1 putative response regulator receiver domain protein [Actinoplanes missouriensis 431]